MQTKYRGKPAHDEFSGASRMIGEVSSNIYEGLVYKASGASFAIAAGAHAEFVLRTPAAPTLIQILGAILTGQGNPWRIELREDVVGTLNPEIVGAFKNLNRSSILSTNLTVYDNATITDDGLLLDEGDFGGTAGQGSNAGDIGGGLMFFGWMLKPDSNYSIRAINNTGTLATLGIDLVIRESTSPQGS